MKEVIFMCTAFSWHGRYFGRNLDLEYRYREAVVNLPRHTPIAYRHLPPDHSHYAMIGMATVEEGYPLFYDGMNEYGLCAAGLHFVGNARYFAPVSGKLNLAPYELIPYLLTRCRSIREARKVLSASVLTDTPFSDALPLSELHFLVSDREGSLVIESGEKGLSVYDAPWELLTNNPPYPFHERNIEQYRHLSEKEGEEGFSRGLSAFGLPGDLSSSSRFVRAAFVKEHACYYQDTARGVGQCFHILSSVKMVEGCIRLRDGGMPKTVYSACLDRETLSYHVITYDDPLPLTVRLSREGGMSECEIFS